MNVSFFQKTVPFFLLTAIIAGFSSASFSAEEKVDAPSSSQQVIIEESVNINVANAAEISSTLKGIGLKKAEAIVTWRNTNGQFSSLDQLLEVKGVGEKTLLQNKHKIKL
jgi:competence protein ComEA